MKISDYDDVLKVIAKYCSKPLKLSKSTLKIASLCLADAIGCAMLALKIPECTKLLRPLFGEKGSSRVLGTNLSLSLIESVFDTAMLIRWLDFNDTWLAAEWGHPSDNIGALLPLADFICLQKSQPFKVKELLEYIVKAYEIQGVLSLSNNLNRSGFDHVLFVKAATAATTCKMLGGSSLEIANVLSHVFIDLGPLRTYRHAPNTGPRKSWAAGDAAARGLFLAGVVLKGEAGYPKALTAPKWGFNDVILKKPLTLEKELGHYVIDNILFKVCFPAEFHAQTALEAAIILHPFIKGRFNEIDTIHIDTHESAIRIIDKKGPLTCPADRDHCLQYIVAIGLIKGDLDESDYEEKASKEPLIDFLRDKMVVKENKSYSQDYLDPEKRFITSAVQVFFKNGETSAKVEIDCPLGHAKRRKEALPFLEKKLFKNLSARFNKKRAENLLALFQDFDNLIEMPVNALMDLLVK